MHVPTYVIVQGNRSQAYEGAYELTAKAAPKYCDWWAIKSGRWANLFVNFELLSENTRFRSAIYAKDLPKPLPEDLVPVALVTPRGAFLWKPVTESKRQLKRWDERVNRLIDQYHDGHSVVIMDVHC